MTPAEHHALRQVTDYLEALLNDAVQVGLSPDCAADIRIVIANARAVLAHDLNLH